MKTFQIQKTRYECSNKRDNSPCNNYARCNPFLFVCCCNLNNENTGQLRTKWNKMTHHFTPSFKYPTFYLFALNCEKLKV